jgi:hypothetical protein
MRSWRGPSWAKGGAEEHEDTDIALRNEGPVELIRKSLN